MHCRICFKITCSFFNSNCKSRNYLRTMLTDELKEAIALYHRKGYPYRLIHYLLEKKHNHVVSYLQKKLIPGLGLIRRGHIGGTFEEVIHACIKEIGDGVAGSEALRKTLALKYKISAPRSVTRQLVRILDGEGVTRRKMHRLRRRLYISKGPNYAWHLDGYDKLCKSGIYIHGCIDGFSRKVLWLRCGITNRRPQLIARYFLDAAADEGGFPWLVRGDRGTENSTVAEIVRAQTDRNGSFLYGKSTSNQVISSDPDQMATNGALLSGAELFEARIERWWGYLRQARADFWIHEFKNMERDGLIIQDDPVGRMCLQYSFMPFISAQLDEVREIWNCHIIRPQKKGDTVAGVPEILHSLSEVHDAENHMVPVQQNTIRMLKDRHQTTIDSLPENFLTLVHELTERLQLPSPEELTSFEMCRHYFRVLSEVVVKLVQ